MTLPIWENLTSSSSSPSSSFRRVYF